MANERNLKRLSPSEARENGRKGGKASGESRRAKRTLTDAIRLAMSYGLTEEEKQALCNMQVSEGDQTQATLIAVGLIKKAKEGDIKAIDYLRRIFTHNNADFSVYGFETYEEEL